MARVFRFVGISADEFLRLIIEKTAEFGKSAEFRKINLIFDLLLPSDCNLSSEEAEKQVIDKIHEKKENCFCVIRVEHPYV